MSKEIKNPEAFARPASVGIDYLTGEDCPVDSQRGMSLRDYFAAAALQGLLANSEIAKSFVKGKECSFVQGWHSETSYRFADAMLEARDVKSD